MNKCIEVLAYSQVVVTTKINTGPLIQTCKAHVCILTYRLIILKHTHITSHMHRLAH